MIKTLCSSLEYFRRDPTLAGEQDYDSARVPIQTFSASPASNVAAWRFVKSSSEVKNWLCMMLY